MRRYVVLKDSERRWGLCMWGVWYVGEGFAGRKSYCWMGSMPTRALARWWCRILNGRDIK